MSRWSDKVDNIPLPKYYQILAEGFAGIALLFLVNYIITGGTGRGVLIFWALAVGSQILCLYHLRKNSNGNGNL